MASTVRTRFAPSPTGVLHIGGARTAAFNWAFAKKNKGIFVLRIEDTDRDRSQRAYEEAILRDLKWLGISWDEGPDINNTSFGPYRQSERMDFYKKYFDLLRARNVLYPCYCSKEELEAERRSLLRQGKPPRYSGKCFYLSEEERKEKERSGVIPSWRFRVPHGKSIVLQDLIRGEVRFQSEAIGDFIVWRSDGWPTYNFACVVDDALMKITHVIRGEEHLPNTPYQLLLYQLLDWEPPQFAHVPIILDENRSKLSKRRKSVNISELREQGFLPQAILNFLFLLGHSFPDGCELVPYQELPGLFSMERIARSSAVFDFKKLIWINASYLRMMDTEEIKTGLKELFSAEEIERWEKEAGGSLRMAKILKLASEEANTLRDVGERIQKILFFKFSVTDGEEKEIVKLFCSALPGLPVNCWENEEAMRNLLKEIQKESGFSAKKFFQTLRMVLMGCKEGPGLDALLVALGRDKVYEKLCGQGRI
ncbi:MAG: nondiscriminating glutamyl-tRNA synthetase [Candidatus Atribacteria bacterium]|uniref:glutamate--tRNA ligase n=1 Tax=Atrimonas thermophila TaxID=3064161 RepID=UPI0024AB6710|nr:nondiscriminating glutamyl-tRNA synthetase [Candidatus Atribacteria bacterium]MDI3530687.1 nondiscriminating glutamyl-tRNA synthetase [Candidatus Atribacteria bacterium]